MGKGHYGVFNQQQQPAGSKQLWDSRGENPEQELTHVGDTNKPHSAKAVYSLPAQHNTGARGRSRLGETERRTQGEVSWPYLASIQRILFSR